MKFSQMKYERPELSQVQTNIRSFLSKFKEASSAREAMDTYISYDDYMNKEVTHFGNLAYIRYSIDTNDQFYEGEVDFWTRQALSLKKTQTPLPQHF